MQCITSLEILSKHLSFIRNWQNLWIVSDFCSFYPACCCPRTYCCSLSVSSLYYQVAVSMSGLWWVLQEDAHRRDDPGRGPQGQAGLQDQLLTGWVTRQQHGLPGKMWKVKFCEIVGGDSNLCYKLTNIH